jgi:hypothetical protein
VAGLPSRTLLAASFVIPVIFQFFHEISNFSLLTGLLFPDTGSVATAETSSLPSALKGPEYLMDLVSGVVPLSV